MIVHGGNIIPAEIEAWNDHRIAMAFSIPGIARGGITINGAESVDKTFPDFWAILESTGGKLKQNE